MVGMGELYRVTECMFSDGVCVWYKTVSAAKQLDGVALLFG